MRKKGERLPEVSPAKVPRLFRPRAKLFKFFNFLLVFCIRPGGDNFLMGGYLDGGGRPANFPIAVQAAFAGKLEKHQNFGKSTKLLTSARVP